MLLPRVWWCFNFTNDWAIAANKAELENILQTISIFLNSPKCASAGLVEAWQIDEINKAKHHCWSTK